MRKQIGKIKPFVNIPALLGALGFVMFIISAWYILKILNHDRVSLKTTGIITKYIEKLHAEPPSKYSGPSYIVGYYPVIEFTNFYGEKMQFTSDVLYGVLTKPPLGSKLEVFYDPSNPSKANLVKGEYTIPAILNIIGLFFAVNWIRINRKTKTNEESELQT